MSHAQDHGKWSAIGRVQGENMTGWQLMLRCCERIDRLFLDAMDSWDAAGLHPARVAGLQVAVGRETRNLRFFVEAHKCLAQAMGGGA
jgi:hypothetical protein